MRDTYFYKHWPLLGGAFVISILSYIVFQRAIACEAYTDYAAHFLLMVRMEAAGRITLPHFLYHILTIGLRHIPIVGTLQGAALLVSVMAHVAYYLVLHYAIWRDPIRRDSVSAALISLAFVLAGPISLFTFPVHNLYLGYIGMATYHSPTMTLMRPLAFLHVVLFQPGEERFGARRKILSVVILVLGMLAKPAYAVVAAAGWIVAFLVTKDRRRFMWDVALLMWLPVVLVVGWQYLFTYLTPENGLEPTHVLFAPLLAMRTASIHLIWKLLASIGFPLLVAILFRDVAFKERYYVVALASFLFGSAILYLLAESGPRLIHLNFAWFGQIGLLLWTCASVRIVVQVLPRMQSSSKKIAFQALLFLVSALHVISGVLWYEDQVRIAAYTSFRDKPTVIARNYL